MKITLRILDQSELELNRLINVRKQKQILSNSPKLVAIELPLFFDSFALFEPWWLSRPDEWFPIEPCPEDDEWCADDWCCLWLDWLDFLDELCPEPDGDAFAAAAAACIANSSLWSVAGLYWLAADL